MKYNEKIAIAQDMRREGKKMHEIGEVIGVNNPVVSQLAAQYCECGNDRQRGFAICQRCMDIESIPWGSNIKAGKKDASSVINLAEFDRALEAFAADRQISLTDTYPDEEELELCAQH
jgi:hypothetical protein